MLLLKRLLTTAVLCVFLFIVLYFGTMMVGGGLVGARLAAQQQAQSGGADQGFDRGYQIGLQAGVQFRQEWGPTILWITLGVAVVGAVGLSFSGALPWCRRGPQPPPLPGQVGVT